MYEENVWGDELPQVKSPALDQSQFFAARDEESEAVSGVDDEDEGFTSAPASPGNSRPAFLTDEPEEMSTTPWALQSLSSPSQPSAAATGFPGGFPGDSDEDQQQQLQQDDPFASTTAGDNAGADDDEFGDFGDFGDGQNENNADDDDGFGDFEESAAATPAPLASTSIPIASTSNTKPIDVGGDIASQVQDILDALIPIPEHLQHAATTSPPRELLGTDSARELFASLTQTPSDAAGLLHWKRSRTRQAYFNALGIPFDLEAEQQQASGRKSESASGPWRNQQPPSRVSTPTQATSPHLNPRPSTPVNTAISASRSAPVSRAGSPAHTQQQQVATPVPPPPELDRTRAQKLIGMTADELNAQPLNSLREIQEELEGFIKLASAQLTHGMDMQEKLAGDAETYDRMIQDLVSTAQKLKPAASSTVSLSNAGKDLKRSDSLPSSRRSTGLWGRSTSRGSGPASQQQQPGSSLRKSSLHY